MTKRVNEYPAGIKLRSTLATFTANAATSLITAAANHALVGTPAYTSGNSVICAKCHDLENFTTPGTTTYTIDSRGGVSNVSASNNAHSSHHQDQSDGSPQCVNCHVAIPHGWNAPRLLVDTDVDKATYVSANQLGTTVTRSTGLRNNGTVLSGGVYYGPSTIGAANPAGVAHPGFNGHGMQSLSGVDNHLLVNGAAIWTEASCQACGDHAGEDGVRIVNP